MRAGGATATAIGRIHAVDPRDDAAWHALATGPHGSLFTSPPWIQALSEGYGFTPEARIAVDDAGRATDGVAWVAVRDLRGERVVSLPFSDRAEPLTGDPATWRLLTEDARAGGVPFAVRCLDGAAPARDPDLRPAGEVAWHGTSLAGSAEELFGRLAPTVRRNLRAGERRGVRVEARTDLAAVRELHRLHVRLRKRKYRLLAQPLGFFERIWDAFAPSGGAVTFLATVDGEPVAGALTLVWGDTLYYKFGASAPERLAHRPNEAIHWAALRWAMARGLRRFDWGVSDLDQPGLVGYKRRWASEERRVVTLRSGAAPGADEAGAVLGNLTRLLTDPSVPDAITTDAGATLYRYFC